MDTLRSKRNYPFFWFDNGCSIEDSFEYAKTSKKYGLSLCKWCNGVFSQIDGTKSCCSNSCYDSHRLRGYKKLSISRNKYNPRNPIHYAERHNITIVEAELIVKERNITGTQLRKEYWLKLGYTDDQAKEKVSEVQSNNSTRHPNHWLKLGYTEDQAKEKVSEVQSNNTKIGFEKYTKAEIQEQSSFCYLFWMKKGYSEQESKDIVTSISAKGHQTTIDRYTIEERRKFNVMCKEYWIKRFPADWEEKYVEFRSRTNQN